MQKDEVINIIGMGYIGCTAAINLAEQGYDFVGVDIDTERVEELCSGSTGFSDLEKEFRKHYGKKNIIFTDNYDHINGSTTVICVDTPFEGSSIDLTNIKLALKELGKRIERDHTVIIRSTVLPSSCEEELIPLLEDVSGLSHRKGLHVCYAPEFLRGGTGLSDYANPSRTVCAGDPKAVSKFTEITPQADKFFETSFRTAEATKYFDNMFHALKISFSNEVARFCHEKNIDPTEIMNILKEDQKLNISEKYLDPGYPFGGPCLEKDLKALLASSESLEIPLANSILESNRKHFNWIKEKIQEKEDVITIGLAGLSYKAGISSTTASPSLKLAEKLVNEDYDVIGYDPNVENTLINQAHSIEELQKKSDVVVILNKEEEFLDLDRDNETIYIDLMDIEN